MIIKEIINGIEITVNSPKSDMITINDVAFHKNSWNEIKKTIDKMLKILDDDRDEL